MNDTILSQPVNDAANASRLSGVERLIQYVSQFEPVRMAVVHPCDELSLRGALDAHQAGLIDPVLAGPKGRLQATAAQAGVSLEGCEIVDVPHSHAAAATAAHLAGKKEVEALMKGSLHTDEFLNAILTSSAGLRTERRLSHCYVMETAA